MKTTKLILTLSLIALFVITGCAKRATKEQAVEQRMKLITWYESDDFKKLLLDNIGADGQIKDQAKFEANLKAAEDKKINEIIASMGFKNQEEFQATEDVTNSPEVKAATLKLEEVAKNRTVQILTEFYAKKAEEALKTAEPQ